jgi:hypothetical protein
MSILKGGYFAMLTVLGIIIAIAGGVWLALLQWEVIDKSNVFVAIAAIIFLVGVAIAYMGWKRRKNTN